MDELETKVTEEVEPEVEATPDSAEIAKLRAELAKQKAAFDKAAKEAGDYKKQLRAKLSAEEIAAEEKRAQDEERDRKLAEYEKRFFISETSKKFMWLFGNEEISDQTAEFLSGAEDVDGFADALKKAWNAREKQLRLEYGKIPAPGMGSSEGLSITKEQLDSMKFTERVKFANEHPDDYNKLMGR